MTEQKKHIEWAKVRDMIENNWTFYEGSVIYNPDHIDEMAIGIAGEIDKVIQNKLKSLLDDLMAIAEKTIISECVGDDPEGYIIMDKDFQAIKKKHLGDTQ